MRFLKRRVIFDQEAPSLNVVVNQIQVIPSDSASKKPTLLVSVAHRRSERLVAARAAWYGTKAVAVAVPERLENFRNVLCAQAKQLGRVRHHARRMIEAKETLKKFRDEKLRADHQRFGACIEHYPEFNFKCSSIYSWRIS